jgi:hypothetical protein
MNRRLNIIRIICLTISFSLAYCCSVFAKPDGIILEKRTEQIQTVGVDIKCDSSFYTICKSEDTEAAPQTSTYFSICKCHIIEDSEKNGIISLKYSLPHSYEARMLYYLLDNDDQLIDSDTLELESADQLVR